MKKNLGIGSLGPVGNTGLLKGDWTCLSKANGYTLWSVITKEGAAHEAVTFNFYGEDIIVEIDEEKVW